MSFESRSAKSEALTKIEAQRESLKATLEQLKGERGMMVDVMSTMIPIFEEQLDIMELIIKGFPVRADSAGYVS